MTVLAARSPELAALAGPEPAFHKTSPADPAAVVASKREASAESVAFAAHPPQNQS